MNVSPIKVLEALQQRATRDKELALHLEAAILTVALEDKNGVESPEPELELVDD